MGDSVPHQGPTFEHKVARQHRADRAHQRRDQKRVDHEIITQRSPRVFKKKADGIHELTLPLEALATSRREARMPCLGAQNSAKPKSADCNTTMQPPTDASRK